MSEEKTEKKTKKAARTSKDGTHVSTDLLYTSDEIKAHIKKHRWNHYVYGLCLDIGLVFYIGKGTGSRLLDHAKDAKKGDPSQKAQVIRAIGDRLRYTIFMCCADDRYALGAEAHAIRVNSDCLLNVVIPSESLIHAMHAPVTEYEVAMEVALSAQMMIAELIAQCDSDLQKWQQMVDSR